MMLQKIRRAEIALVMANVATLSAYNAPASSRSYSCAIDAHTLFMDAANELSIYLLAALMPDRSLRDKIDALLGSA